MSDASRHGLRRIAGCLAVLIVTATAVAQMPRRNIGLHWRRNVPHISVGLRDLINERVRRELRSGIRKRIVITAQTYRVGNSRPLASRTFTCAVMFDIWEQSFNIRIGSGIERFNRLEDVVDRCLSIRGMPVGNAGNYANVHGRDVYFAVRAEFDPIDPTRCRQLLRSSGNRGDPIGPIVVNIIRRDICQADRVVEFRSGTHTVPR